VRLAGFIGPSYVSQSVNVDCQRCVNWFPEIDDLRTGKEGEVASLVPTPGLLRKLTLPNSPVRGLFTASNGTLFAVGGQKLYSVSSSWVATELGSLNTSSGSVSMADNGIYVFLVDGQYGYTWNLNTSTFAQVTDPDFPGADQVTFQDGYFIFNKPDSQEFFISGLDDVTFDALDIAFSEGLPDNVVGLVSHQQNLIVFGSQSIEVYYDSGDTFPFTRMQGAVLDVGCSAVFTIQKLQDSVYWIGGDATGSGIVYRSEGFKAVRISTSAIESVIRGMSSDDIASSRAFVYQQGGHRFYCLNLTGVDTTYCFDATTGFWHERSYLNLWSLERHRADCHAVAYGLNVVGDYENGKIYALDPDTLTDDGTYIKRMRRSPHASDGLVRIRHNAIQIDMETGVGLSGTGQGTDPVIMVRWSDDGGHVWSNEYQMSIGKIGAYTTRAIRRRLGSSRDRIYEISITDPVKAVLIGAEIDVEKGVA